MTGTKRQIQGPFGPADYLRSVPVRDIANLYRAKCDYDPTPHFGGLTVIELYKCRTTGVRFWRPEQIAGSEDFYRELSGAWTSYYQEWRWEYDIALQYLADSRRLLEVGCGRGYFLRATEGLVAYAKGLELNKEAIANRVTGWHIEALDIANMARNELRSYDFVCSFQVLEHVADPAEFMAGALATLRPGGYLALSVPNQAHSPLRSDPFDLPPHHMNQFTKESLQKIADYFGIQLVQTYTEVRRFKLERIAKPSPAASARTAAVNFVKRSLNTYYAWSEKSGQTMFAVFRS